MKFLDLPLVRWLRSMVVALLSPLHEKNPAKTDAVDAPVVFSMSRVVVLAFAWAMLYQIRHAGIVGWPEATLCIFIVIALPLLAALERVSPAAVLDFGRAVLERVGVGEARTVGVANGANSVYAGEPAPPLPSREPSKFDDHRED